MQRFLNNKLLIYSAVLAFFGFLDSLYLTVLHYKNIIPPCSVHFGCEKVLTSAFSMLGPIPLALFGVIFYLTVILTCLLILIEGRKELVKFFHFTVLVGFLFSVVLFFIQFVILQSFCQYCLLSEVISTGLLMLSLLKLREDKKNN
ncbi:MAG TPA: vitamin K epoxide reductase family protein [Patescibacteria group bacterium]|jgi:uncharacterized membrane protein|nr:vitamin K epoxide reductase family protein [Patescibacteria group bacterium]